MLRILLKRTIKFNPTKNAVYYFIYILHNLIKFALKYSVLQLPNIQNKQKNLKMSHNNKKKMSLANFPLEMSTNIFFETYGPCKTCVTSSTSKEKQSTSRKKSITSSVSTGSFLKPPTSSSNGGITCL